MNNFLCIIQARMRAARLPGKVFKKVNGVTLLEYEINRVKKSKLIDKIVIATTTEEQDERIEKLCKQIKIDCFRGSEEDVLNRYFECAKKYPEYKNIIRITGDCPLVDPKIIDQVIDYYLDGSYDYVSSAGKGEETLPDGMDVEVFRKRVLKIANQEAKLKSEREHVTPFMHKDKRFKIDYFKLDKDYSKYRLTVDEPEDFEVIEFLIKNSPVEAGYLDYIEILNQNSKIMALNQGIIRNEGYVKSLNEDCASKTQSN